MAEEEEPLERYVTVVLVKADLLFGKASAKIPRGGRVTRTERHGQTILFHVLYDPSPGALRAPLTAFPAPDPSQAVAGPEGRTGGPRQPRNRRWPWRYRDLDGS